MSLSKKIKSEVDKIIKNFDDIPEDKIIEQIKEIVLEDKPMPRTQSARFSRIKKLFKEVTDDKEFLSKIRPDKQITQKIIENNNEVRDDRRLININEDIVKKILSFEDSSDPFLMAIYLLFVSGRRVSELLEADFINKKKNRNIAIKGIKKRTDEKECEFMPLVNKTKFFRELRKFESFKKFLNMNTFHRRLNRKIKQQLGDKYFPHILRGMYVIYAFTFRNKENLKINSFIKKYLCHQSINASLNYTQYKITFNKDIIK